MKRTALAALLSHWRRQPLQLVTLVLGLALATALWSGVQAINAEARASYGEAAETLGANRPVIRAETGSIPQEVYVALRRAGWPVTPVIDGRIAGVRLLGIEPLTAPDDLGIGGGGDGGGDGAAFLDFVRPPGQLVAAPETAERLRGVGIPIVIGENTAPGIALADIGIAQQIMEMDGALSRLIVTGDVPPGDVAAFHPDLVLAQPEATADPGQLTDSFHLNLTAFGFLSFAVGLLIVHGAIGLAFEQRRTMFRTLRALGVSARTLTTLAVAELTVLALISGILGIALGYVIASLLIPDVAATLRGLYGVPVEGSLTLRASWWTSGLGIALLGTGVAAAGTIWKIAHLSVLAPARPRAWAQADARLTRAQGAVSAALLLVALVAGMLGGGLIAGFLMLGAFLLAAALALPLGLGALLSLAARQAKTASAEWFWADTRQQLPGLSLALMALLLALATNIGVGTMVSSFRLTFIGWLDQRLASELYVRADSEAQAVALQEWLAPRADAVLPIWSVEADVLGAPAQIYGVADHATYRDLWPLIEAVPEVWDLVHAGGAALVNEQLALRESLDLGDTLPLPGGWSPAIAGIYSDYGNMAGQVFIAVDALTTHYPEVERLNFGIRIANEQVEPLSNALVTEFGLNEGNITDQRTIKAASLDIFERTFTVTGGLNVLTLAIAGFAILTSLLTLGSMRLPQLAPAWALGLPRVMLARLEIIRTLALAALTFAFALPLGLGLAWILLAVINVEAFGWRLPMHLFPAQWLRLGVLALLAAGLAALWPAISLRRRAPADLLRIFSHER